MHFEVSPDEASITDRDLSISTLQLALPQEVCDTVYATTGYVASIKTFGQFTGIADDSILGDNGGESQLATVTGDVTDGYLVMLDFGVDATTAEHRDVRRWGRHGRWPLGWWHGHPAVRWHGPEALTRTTAGHRVGPPAGPSSAPGAVVGRPVSP